VSASGDDIPPEVRAAMGDALAALDAAPDGWLVLPARRRLRAAFGPWAAYETPGWPDAGVLRRAALLAACAEQALPVWEQAFPSDDRPRRLIDLVRQTLRGDAPEDRLRTATEALRRDVDPMGADSALRGPFFAGAAAVRLSYDARDGDLDPTLYPPDVEDSDLDEPQVEALAAQATVDDAEGRRAFWRWYVTEAFPDAYRAAP
jgi:Immunity protein Imm5